MAFKFIYIYIYVCIYTYLLLPFLRSGKYFTNQVYFHEMEKTLMIYSTVKWKNISNRETGKYVYLNKFEKIE